MGSEKHPPGFADEKGSVAAVYEDERIAQSYLDKRMRFSWQRLLHRRQVAILQSVVDGNRNARILEVAPGPARLATDLSGVASGTMVENSHEMVSIARARLASRRLDKTWNVITGDAFALDASIGESAFDLAYTFRFLRHFRDEERGRLYGQLARALVPGGLLVFDVVCTETFNEVERKNKVKPADEIPIYDVTYTKDSFVREMAAHGFDTVDMIAVLPRFPLQSWLSYKLDDVAPRLTGWLVSLLERLPSATPLEWVAICRKR